MKAAAIGAQAKHNGVIAQSIATQEAVAIHKK